MFASIIINAKAAKQVKGGYPWVFARDVLSRRFPTAGIVGVLDKRGEFLGQAFYSPTSKIVLRLITKSKVKIDKNFWVERTRVALERRLNTTLLKKKGGPLVPPFVKGGEGGFGLAFRVVYAESDGMPSIIIDKYNDIVSFQITSAGAETVKEDIIAAIAEVLGPAAIIEKNDVGVRKLEGLPLIEKIVYGNKATTIVTEGDQRFEVDVLHGQKTGAYLDYRRFRLNPPSPPFAKGGKGGISALDLFCYQGWMACHLAKNFAKVVAVDASQGAINAAKRNAELNGIPLCHFRNSPSPCGRELEGGVTPHPGPLPQGGRGGIEFICVDVFEYLRTCKVKFDFIHLDPPPFAKGHKNLPVAIKAYKKLNVQALEHLNPGGILFTSSCSHHISENILDRIVQDAAKVSGFKFQVIYRGAQDSDHPILKGFPESLYLKGVAIQI